MDRIDQAILLSRYVIEDENNPEEVFDLDMKKEKDSKTLESIFTNLIRKYEIWDDLQRDELCFGVSKVILGSERDIKTLRKDVLVGGKIAQTYVNIDELVRMLEPRLKPAELDYLMLDIYQSTKGVKIADPFWLIEHYGGRKAPTS